MNNRSRARYELERLFRRCVECPSTSPSCPDCAEDETCSLIPVSCDACASTTCVKIGSLPGQTIAPKSSTPVGPIVGGVIAGLLLIVGGVFCLWWFCIRPRKRKDTWIPPEKTENPAYTSRHSIASTVMTRASNVIQIAYIPGVTGRSPPVSPAMPSPGTVLGLSTGTASPGLDTHFFMPGDLRNSTWSETSVDPRISLAPSLARASVATTLMPASAQPAVRVQPNMVNVRAGNIPTVPPIAEEFAMTTPGAAGGSKIVARNVTARPIEIKKASLGSKVPTVANLAAAAANASNFGLSSAPERNGFSDEKEMVVSRPSIMESESIRGPANLTHVEIDSIPSTPVLHRMQSTQSFSTIGGIAGVSAAEGPLASGNAHRSTGSVNLTAMIEDAIKNAAGNSKGNTPRPDNTRHDSGPFSDIHELASSPPKSGQL